MKCAPGSLAVEAFQQLKKINGVLLTVTIEEPLLKGVFSHPEVKFTNDQELEDLLQRHQPASVRKISDNTAVISWETSDLLGGLPHT